MKRFTYSLVCFLSLSLGFGLSQSAQPPKAEPKKVEKPSPADKSKDKPGPDKPGPDKEPPKESPRLQKLKTVSFDRKPSSILKAWSTSPEKPKTPPDPIDVEIADLQRNVTLGRWPDVKSYLAKLPKEESGAGYKTLLESLQRGPSGPMPQPGMMGPGGPMPMQFMEKNFFAVEDVLGLIGAAPQPLEEEHVKALGGILSLTIQAGTVVESVVARLRAEIARKAPRLTRRQTALILAAAGHEAEIEPFLPDLKQAEDQKDHQALNLLARHFMALHGKKQKTTYLEKAWSATQAVLALKQPASVKGKEDELKKQREEALRRAVDLAARIREELGQDWLEKSFTRDPRRGMEILATIGAMTSQGLQTNPMNPDARFEELRLQKTAVEALLKASPSQAKDWKNTLGLLAGSWLREGEFSYQFDDSTSLGPQMRYDPYGNIYFFNEPSPFNPMYRQPNMPRPIVTGKVVETRPGESWLAQLEEGPRARLAMVFAQLFLKVNEEGQAFPYIEKMSRTHPDEARKLVNEFLRVWARNHDPNSQRIQRSPYFYIFGFNRQAEGISLTRSQQERNLRELAGFVARLRKLPIGDPDEELLAKAFTTSHSSAEVYRQEAIEKVFGPIASLKPRTLAGLVQQMRENLAGLWRKPDVQKDKKTNRQQKDIQKEVLRGYEVAQAVTSDALKKFAGDWSLTLAGAALRHDENSYRQELAKSSEYSQRRLDALAEFHKAARLYAAKVKDLPQDEETGKVFNQWFYASLGATDLAQMDEDKMTDFRQMPLIRKAILGLPGETAERHMARFVNDLIIHLNSVKPALKYRYLRHGLEIAGDHKHAQEARKVFNYYKDLVTEIKLEAKVDGSDVVGHARPFGVFVNLRHTREIERESGGFGRYLQNQNSMYFYYNYGRPNADYRDRFQAAVTEALKEHFEVLSVTFQTDKVNARATEEYGWRFTPYAYMLLKARGPRVDKLPALRMDLDFMDTGGYVIIPIESPAVPIDAAAKKAEPRPVKKLRITQTLDERQADKGKLLLEVKATGLGLVPEMEDILDLAPDNFQVVKKTGLEVSVAKFDEDSADNVVVSERTWMLTLEAKPGLTPQSFRFGKAKEEVAEMTYQRYQDADLVTARPEVELEASYSQASSLWMQWAAVGVVVALGLIGLFVLLLLRKPPPQKQISWELPKTLTPFTVLAFLRRIEQADHLSEPERAELKETMAVLERHYFAGDGNGQVDLPRIAESWMRRAK